MARKNKALFLGSVILVFLSLFSSSCSSSSYNSSQNPPGSFDKILLNKSCLMVIAPENFRDEELFLTKETLESAGINVTVTSVTTGNIKGMLGANVLVNKSISEFNTEDFDCVIIVGGSGAPELLNHQEVLNFVKYSYDSGKLVGAICLGPMILAEAGILTGKEATVFKASQAIKLFEEKNVVFVDEPVVKSGGIITANGPKAAEDFAKAIIEELK